MSKCHKLESPKELSWLLWWIWESPSWLWAAPLGSSLEKNSILEGRLSQHLLAWPVPWAFGLFATKLIRPIVTAAAYCFPDSSISHFFHSWNRGKWLSRNFPGFWHRIWITEALCLVNWVMTSHQPPMRDSACGTISTVETFSLMDQVTFKSSAY